MAPWPSAQTNARDSPGELAFDSQKQRKLHESATRRCPHFQGIAARSRRPGGTPVLFPRPTTNIDGTRPTAGGTYREALYRWLENCDIRDEHGKPVHLTPHQWRHTLGTVLINRDVPQHIVQKILDHYAGDQRSDHSPPAA